jgi:hypothetical protein
MKYFICETKSKCPEIDSVSEGDYEEDPRYSFVRGGINMDGGFPF